MALFRLIVEQRVLANLLFFVLLAAGFLVVGGMPVEEYPNVAMDKIQVIVPWPGASPDDVERVLATELEDKLRDVAGLEWVQSSSYPDRCEVWLKVRDGVEDFQAVYRDVQTEVSKLRGLPEGVEEPIVKKIDVEEMGPSVQVVVGWSGEDLGAWAIEERLRSIGASVRARLEQVPGVKKVRIYGERDRELRIKVDPRALEHFDLDIAEVAAAIAARNVNLPAGSLAPAGRLELAVRSRSEMPSVEAFRRIALRSDDRGPTARLGDVATLEWGFVKEAVRPHFRGQRCLTLAVVKEPTSNALEVVAAARAVLDEARALNPEGVELLTIADTTVRIRERIAVLRTNILLGLTLVLGVLWMSIGFKNAVLASLGIPFSFLCSLILLRIGGESINLISLFSLVLVLGVIVDDALVVLENIHRHAEGGAPLKEAIVRGASEVAVPVVSATLTTIAAFLPMLLMPGTTGRFFAIIPKTVAYALLASLFECLIILPVHIYDFGGLGRRSARGPSRGLLGLRRVYLRALELCLRLRYLALLGLVALAIGAAAILGRVPVLFFPSDFKQFFINVRMPVGTPLDETDRVTREISAILAAMPRSEIESSTCSVGLLFDENYKPLSGGHRAQFFVTTASGPERRRSLEEIMAETRRRIAAAAFLEAAIEVVELNDGPPVGKPVTIRFRGDDLPRLRERGEAVAAGLAELPGVFGVDVDLREGRPELRFVLDEDRAARLGVSAAAVGRALAAANDGVVATSWRRPGDDDAADVRVMLREQDRRLPGDLAALKLRNRFGTLTPLSEVARVERAAGLEAIHRFDGQRALTVTADVDPAILTAAEANRRARDLVAALPQDAAFVTDFEGEFAETARSFESLKISFVVAIGSIFMVLGAQFRSFLQPLVVLVTVPFSFIGVVLGLWLTGDPFTVMSGIAIVGLAGMVVNDSLVLVDFINRRRRDGLPVVRAIRESAVARMRAILLTTITTVFGVLPMALGMGGRSTVWSPMATSIAFGLSFATVLTLFVIPALYLILEDGLALIGRGERVVFDGDWAMLEGGNFDKTPGSAPRRPPLQVAPGGEQGHG